MLVALDAGAEDIAEQGGTFTITTAPSDVLAVRTALEEAGIAIESADTTMIATNSIQLADEGSAKQVLRVIDALEDHDDVQGVFANFDIPESVLGQLGTPDMRVPISYALAWPERIETPAARLNLAQIGQLTFEAPDPTRFPALGLARLALQTGGAAPTILNAANEVAVHGFLAGRLGFLDIARVVESTLGSITAPAPASIDEVRAIDAEVRARAGARLAA